MNNEKVVIELILNRLYQYKDEVIDERKDGYLLDLDMLKEALQDAGILA
jgi:hypothetical protein